MATETPSAAIVGAGPSGLMAAETLASAGIAVTLYDRMPSIGRKFLMAGRGGLNLTHTEPFDAFVTRYGSATPALRDALAQFPPDRLRAWCEALGQPTFVGSSGRIFPEAMKASPLLRAWLRRLERAGVRVALRHRWTGWADDGALQFTTPGDYVTVRPDTTILALGGATWPQLGSDGAWTAAADAAGLAVAPFRPANGGFTVGWSALFRDRFEGEPLKNVALRFRGRTVRGDVVVTREGIEGGAVYGLSADLREALLTDGTATVAVALRPDRAEADLARRLADRPSKQSLSTWLRKSLRLAPVAIGLLQESTLGNAAPLGALSAEELAWLVNAVPVRVSGVAPLERAISSAGGLAFAALDEAFMIRTRPGTFVAGEMLDWEAPTGGYLLQACFATGAAAGRGALAWLSRAG